MAYLDVAKALGGQAHRGSILMMIKILSRKELTPSTASTAPTWNGEVDKSIAYIRAVTQGFHYKMRSVYAHFPISSVVQERMVLLMKSEISWAKNTSAGFR